MSAWTKRLECIAELVKILKSCSGSCSLRLFLNGVNKTCGELVCTLLLIFICPIDVIGIRDLGSQCIKRVHRSTTAVVAEKTEHLISHTTWACFLQVVHNSID